MFKKIGLLFIGIIYFFIGFLFLFGQNKDFSNFSFSENGIFSSSQVYAADSGDSESQTGGLIELLEKLVQSLYVILWPLLMVAGSSLDNSLVFGEVFNLDVSLWKFWNIMKNFANYALGFIFIFSVLIYIFNSKFSDKFNPKKILPKLLIAGVAIQASWFIVAALIDLSTVATYGLGTLPIEVMGEQSSDQEKSIAFPHVVIDLNDSEKKISEMENFMHIYYSSPSMEKDEVFMQCIFSGGKLEEFSEKMQENFENTISDSKNLNTDNCVYKNFLVKNEKGTPINELIYDVGGNNKGSGMDKFIDRSSGFTGPLFTLYNSILRLGDIPLTSSNKSAGALTLIFLIKTLVAAALIVPLLTLAVVLIIRVVVLWLVIGFSPLIVLSETFGFKLGGEKANLKSIIGLIFLPVMAVFAISISILFLSLLNEFNYSASDSNNDVVKEALGLENPECGGGEEEDSKNYAGLKLKNLDMDICFALPNKESGISPILDIFSWLIINLFGIGLMWAVVFAAMKTSKVTDGVVSGIESFATSTAKATPIVPTPMGRMSVGGLEKAGQRLPDIPQQKISQQYREGPGKQIENFIKGMGDDTAYEGIKEDQSDKFVKALQDSKPSSSKAFTSAAGRALQGNGSHYNNVQEVLKSEAFANALKDSDLDAGKFVDNLESLDGLTEEEIQKLFAKNISENGEDKIINGNPFYKLGKYVYKLDSNKEKVLGGAYHIPDNITSEKDLQKLINDLNSTGLDEEQINQLLEFVSAKKLNEYQINGKGISYQKGKFEMDDKNNNDE